MLPVISLVPLPYKGREYFGFRAPFGDVLEREIRGIPGVRWAKEYGCYVLPLQDEHYVTACAHLKGKAQIGTGILDNFLEQRKLLLPFYADSKLHAPLIRQLAAHPVCAANTEAFIEFRQELMQRGFSARTQGTYCKAFHSVLRALGEIPVHTLDNGMRRELLLRFLHEQEYSPAHMQTCISVLKFYFEKVRCMSTAYFKIPRPGKYDRLQVLYKEELIKGTTLQLREPEMR